MRELLDSHLVNHVALKIDESSSMSKHKNTVVKVVDGLVADLAEQSTDLGQETRLSVYAYSSRGTPRCLVWDVDVLRVPSIEGRYEPNGLTALIDCACLAIDDLHQIPEMYGDHAFLLYDVSDGMENDSVKKPADLRQRHASLPNNWTAGIFVPDERAERDAGQCGFGPGSIQRWNPSGHQAVEQLGDLIRATSRTFMQNRAQGVRGSRNLFQMGTVSSSQVRAQLDPLPGRAYELLTVDRVCEIRPFVEMASTAGVYVRGRCYYQHTKTEKIQGNKDVAIEGADGRIYKGSFSEVRAMLGLPDYEVKVQPGSVSDTTIFVQSNSVNRHLMPGTRVLVMK